MLGSAEGSVAVQLSTSICRGEDMR